MQTRLQDIAGASGVRKEKALFFLTRGLPPTALAQAWQALATWQSHPPGLEIGNVLQALWRFRLLDRRCGQVVAAAKPVQAVQLHQNAGL